ncbi:hybrid sensor histidine kinase/response regulator [Niveibacterium sp. 24ML]|uniref:ATP-binding response regulator n=1 Tax=Niveibacterium sp. 24ML TaxID=2985512 RepID=UPI00226F2BEA|nr:hybrid sensor histidine kinase/response regulator [Niveibacterium sp. 24ML]MCX9156254.1 hybrid sensor histidine kinase/response regulator [Niveibacterium sp. 24ML]
MSHFSSETKPQGRPTNPFGDGVVLVVDDFSAMRRVTVNQLRQLGAAQIIEARNGAEAWEVIQNQPIALVMSDWNMPLMDGYELLERVRANPATSALPFMMITTEGERRRVERAIAAGVSELVVKPYTSAVLAERVARALRWRPRRAEAPPSQPFATNDAAAAPARAAAHSGSAPSVRASLLVVDDMPDNLTLLAGLFKQDYQVKVAQNGERALTICQSDDPPDLVLLDIMMPDMDGFEVAEAIRSHPSSEHIPIVFVTALTDDAARHRAMTLGAIDFVTKPIDPDTLQMRVKNFLRYIELHRGLQQDYDTMMEAARLREDVEQITRHDIKGPLAGVLGLTQSLLENAGLSDEVKSQLQLIEDSAHSALDLINRSAELYKIETGRFELAPQPVMVARLLRRLIEVSRKTFAAKDIVIRFELPSGSSAEDIVAWGDGALLHSALQNLLKNACEAIPQGGAVDVAIESTSPVAIVMRNDGVVPVEVRERFFDKFATAGKREGTGLGTYSARLMLEAQHGTISMETSDADQATTIRITIPAPPSAKA